MKTKIRPHLQLRVLILIACSALLVWLVVTRSLAAYLAGAAPQAALWLNSQQPEALLNLADRSLSATGGSSEFPSDGADLPSAQQVDQTPVEQNVDGSDDSDLSAVVGNSAVIGNPSPGQSSEPRKHSDSTNTTTRLRDLLHAFAVVDRRPSADISQLRAQAIVALTRDPLNARAFRILGQLAEIANDDASALKFMTVAARLSLHETVAVYWLMRRSAATGDSKTALLDADALMRTDPNLATYAVPVLAHFADDKTSSGAVTSLLASNPPWRTLFFRLLPGSVTDARTPLNLLLALKKSPVPPTYDDIGQYENVLIAHKFYDLAYYTWLQFLPLDELRTAGLLFNGNFDFAPSGMPFDWAIRQGSGVAVDIVPRRDKAGEHALEIDFLYGRVDYHSVTELVLLAPGTYQFEGQYRGKIVGPRGLKWRIVCANDSHTRIGESPMIIGIASGWKQTNFTFTVPPTDCRAQYVELDLDARMASEQLVSGSALFDELKITRVSTPPPEAPAAASTPQATGQ